MASAAPVRVLALVVRRRDAAQLALGDRERPNSLAKARNWPAAVLATDTHGCALVWPESGLVIVSPSVRMRAMAAHVGRPGLDVDREHRAVLCLEDIERLQTRRNAAPFSPCLIGKPVRVVWGASRVKFGGCGTNRPRFGD